MSYTYLQEQEVESSEEYCWDTDPCALLSLTSTQEKCFLQDKKMDACQDFPSGMMSQPSTELHGEEKLTFFAEVSLAKILAALEKAKGLKVKEAGCGGRWHGLSMKYSHSTSLLKTHHCLFGGVLQVSSVILPKWGMMQDGVFWARTTLEATISGKDAGYWPTPLKEEGPGGKHKKLTDAVAIAEGYKPRYYKEHGTEDRVAFTGKVNPDWIEWLMGWPMGWTNALQELEMDKFRLWQQQHGLY